MQLTHLGASYTPSTKTLETIETDARLSFMGQTFNMRVPKMAPAKSVTRNLTYRGIRYTT